MVKRRVWLLIVTAITLALVAGILLLGTRGEPTEIVPSDPGSRNQVRFGLPYLKTERGQTDLFLATEESNIRLTRDAATETDPVLSPSGEWVVFASDRADESDLYVISSTGGVPRRITDLRGAEGSPTWAPNEQRLAFVRARSTAREDVYSVRVDGSRLRRVTHLGRITDSPSWSPDGRWIAFTHWDIGHHLFIVRPDGTSLKRVTQDRHVNHDAPAVWAPNSNALAVNEWLIKQTCLPSGGPESCVLGLAPNVLLVSLGGDETRPLSEKEENLTALDWLHDGLLVGHTTRSGYQILAADPDTGSTLLLRDDLPSLN